MLKQEAATRPAPTPSAPTSGYRHEIQALRAAAVTAVLLYHLWPNRFTGGFVGVDVFFVISGFLIGSHLIEELDRTGRIRLAAFWARRARRLLPASLLVLLVTAVAVIAWVPRSRWDQFLGEIVASTFYVENWYLSWSSVDYLAASNSPSPVQHFWTLSVEEQFYILLPLVLIAVLAVSRLLRVRITRLMWGTVVVLFAASLVYGVVSTQWSAASAYFSTFTRAWEFLLGVLVGALPALRAGWIRHAAAAVGLAMIAAACLAYSAETPFPGVAAALPVVGTALAIWGGTSFLSAIGRVPVVSMLGRVSYAVYLWHWPLIVILPHVTGRPLSTIDKLAIGIASIAVGWASTRWVEEPARFSPALLGGRRPRFVAIASIVGMVIVSGVAVSANAVSTRVEEATEQTLEQVIASQPDCFGAAALADPGCENPALEGVIAPDPSNLSADNGNRSDCWSTGGDPTFRMCTLGPEDYTLHLLAIGDSHNNALIPAYEAIAQERGWRIDVAGRRGCYWSAADLPQPTEVYRQECAEWRAQAHHAVAESDADAIVVTKARSPLVASDRALAQDAVIDGLVGAWAHRAGPDVPIIAVSDNPALPEESVRCVEEHGLAAAELCAVPVGETQTFEGLPEAVAATENATYIDMTKYFCTDACSPVVGHVVAYRDDGRHLTATYAETLAPYLADELERALR